jgi:ATP synthase protein I
MSSLENGLVAENLYQKMLRWQMLATSVVAVVALPFGGLHAGLSVAAGGLSVVIGVYLASKIAEKNDQKKDPTAILLNLLKAEAIKIITVAILLLLVFKMYAQLMPFALIAGLATAAIFSGAALAKTDKTI